VYGVDVSTVVFYENQLTITPGTIVPGMLDRIHQLLNNEPIVETLGPFKATNANVRSTKTRALAYYPFEMLEPLLRVDITAHQVFELIVRALIDMGLKDTCSELIHFLTMALVQPNDTRVEPHTLHDQVCNAGYTPGPEAISYRHYYILYRDLPA
jgi:hypothetical protein